MSWSIEATAGVRDEHSENTSAKILEELIAATMSLLVSVCWQQDEGWKCGTSAVVTRFSLEYCCMPLPDVVAQVRKHSTGQIPKEQTIGFLHGSFLMEMFSLPDK